VELITTDAGSSKADFTVRVTAAEQDYNVYVVKRPGVDQFLKCMGTLFRVVILSEQESSVLFTLGIIPAVKADN
jgi:TFIIF-interacting CTD phosphatase-like protein